MYIYIFLTMCVCIYIYIYIYVHLLEYHTSYSLRLGCMLSIAPKCTMYHPNLIPNRVVFKWSTDKQQKYARLSKENQHARKKNIPYRWHAEITKISRTLPTGRGEGMVKILSQHERFAMSRIQLICCEEGVCIITSLFPAAFLAYRLPTSPAQKVQTLLFHSHAIWSCDLLLQPNYKLIFLHKIPRNRRSSWDRPQKSWLCMSWSKISHTNPSISRQKSMNSGPPHFTNFWQFCMTWFLFWGRCPFHTEQRTLHSLHDAFATTWEPLPCRPSEHYFCTIYSYLAMKLSLNSASFWMTTSISSSGGKKVVRKW